MEVDYGEVYSRETEGGGGGLVTHALSELRAGLCKGALKPHGAAQYPPQFPLLPRDSASNTLQSARRALTAAAREYGEGALCFRLQKTPARRQRAPKSTQPELRSTPRQSLAAASLLLLLA